MAHQDFQLRKGRRFATDKELDDFIENYSLQENQIFSVHKSKTIAAANQAESIEPKLVYYSVHYRCHRSGIYIPRGTGQRKTRYVHSIYIQRIMSLKIQIKTSVILIRLLCL